MTNLQTAKRTVERTRDDVRPYLPEVVRRLLIQYGTLFTIIMLLATVGVILLAQVIPASTANLIVLGLNIALLINGWRWLERRLGASGLFALYVRYNRDRRDLEKAVKAAEAGTGDVASHLAKRQEIAQTSAQNFINTAREMGVTPVEQ